MMKNSKLKFSEHMQNTCRSKSFGKFVLIVIATSVNVYLLILQRQLPDNVLETWKDGRNLSLDRLRSFGLYVVPFNGHAMFCFVIHQQENKPCRNIGRNDIKTKRSQTVKDLDSPGCIIYIYRRAPL